MRDVCFEVVLVHLAIIGRRAAADDLEATGIVVGGDLILKTLSRRKRMPVSSLKMTSLLSKMMNSTSRMKGIAPTPNWIWRAHTSTWEMPTVLGTSCGKLSKKEIPNNASRPNLYSNLSDARQMMPGPCGWR